MCLLLACMQLLACNRFIIPLQRGIKLQNDHVVTLLGGVKKLT